MRGKKAWISGDEWPIRAWMSKMEIPGWPGLGNLPCPNILIGREYDCG